MSETKSNNHKTYLLRVEKDLWKSIKQWAQAENRSVNGHISFVLQKALEKEQEQFL